MAHWSQNPIIRARISEQMRQRNLIHNPMLSEEARTKLGRSVKARLMGRSPASSPSARVKIAEWNRLHPPVHMWTAPRPPWTPEHVAAHAERMRQRNALRHPTQDPAVRRKISIAQVKTWQSLSPEDRAAKIRGLRPGASPNKLEQAVQRWLDQYLPGEWRFNVRAAVVIGGMVPDFLHAKAPAVLEMFGDYWHRGEDPSGRVQAFQAVGYHCVVIWEREFKHDPNCLTCLTGIAGA